MTWLVLESTDGRQRSHIPVQRVRYFAAFDFRPRGALTTVIHIEGVPNAVNVEGDHTAKIRAALDARDADLRKLYESDSGMVEGIAGDVP